MSGRPGTGARRAGWGGGRAGGRGGGPSCPWPRGPSRATGSTGDYDRWPSNTTFRRVAGLATPQWRTALSRILVVDDKEENLYLLRALLVGHGHEPVLARNGAEALALAAERRPDMIISDILMPVMDGFTLCRRWKAADSPLKEVPFVFYTATYTEPKDEQLALSLGADCFIVKPIEPGQFLQKISALLEAHEKGSLCVEENVPEPEVEYLREYNAVLIHKLERKLEQLESANRTLAEKDAFNVAVLDAMAALVATLDPQGTILAVNEAWREFTSRSRTRRGCQSLLVGKVGERALDVLGGDRPGTEEDEAARRLRNGLLEVLEGNRHELEAEIPYDEEGEERWFLLRAEHVGAAGAGAVVACLDVTERKRAEEALKEASRRKDEFLAMLGHELRNPLAPIRNASYVLKRAHSQDARAGRATEIIDRQVAHLARIVDDLLDMSRIARGKLTIQREPTDWAEVVRATADDYRAGFVARGVDLRVDVPAVPVWVRGDRTRLAQVVGNLLANAQKFTQRGGRVGVTLVSNERAGVSSLIVRDTGVGMTSEILSRLFEPFEQGPQSSARTTGGFGMGLALVKGLVELHGGEVKAFSNGPGLGSELSVRLPLGDAPAAHPQPTGDPPPAGLRVLVIEDNHDAAESLRTVLEMAGLSVQIAYDGPSGLAVAMTGWPQVILCDIGLPGALDGYAVARAIRADPELRFARLVALTGYGQHDDRRRAEQAGFDAHVTKPAEPDVLLGLLRVQGERSGSREPTPASIDGR